jgi:hypothetical protein
MNFKKLKLWISGCAYMCTSATYLHKKGIEKSDAHFRLFKGVPH